MQGKMKLFCTILATLWRNDFNIEKVLKIYHESKLNVCGSSFDKKWVEVELLWERWLG